MNKKLPFEKLRIFLSKLWIPNKIILIVIGLLSTIWFLIRVIPKPSRAGYPCMQIAAPWMSGFILYLLSLGGITLLFKKSIVWFKKAKYWSATFAVVISLILLVLFNIHDIKKIYANTTGFTRGELIDEPNSPMGIARGVNPGRVVWEWNPEATNEDCQNVIVLKTISGSGWSAVRALDWDLTDAFIQPKNNNQDTINKMADNSIKKLAGENTVSEAWDAIFKNFNNKKTGNATGYTAGQTIFIKVNNGQAGWAINSSDLSEQGTTSAMTGLQNCAMSNTTPATVLAFIKQLVDSCGIAQENIYVGEPMTHVYKSLYDLIHESYPNVIVLDKEDHTDLGRTTSAGWTDDVIFYSDKGDEMPDAVSDNLMQEMFDADYLINLAALKAHARGGVTLTAKLHFGSHGNHNGKFDSFHLHDGLISTVDNDILFEGVRGDYNMYRVLTDIMGHEKLGGNTVLFVVDGLWGGIEATDMPVKWGMAPFNNDFPNSLFVSQDAVALESVCIDFLRAEADKNEYFNDRPFFPAVDDHLHQAADSANWPDGITYDPEGDGTPIPSMGVHEHWNDSKSMVYSGNIKQGRGIELISPTTINFPPGLGKNFGIIQYLNKGEKIVISENLSDLFFDHNGDAFTLKVTSNSTGLNVSYINDSLVIYTNDDMAEDVEIKIVANDGTDSSEYILPVSVYTEGKYIAKYVTKAPVIDGSGSDACWNNVEWRNIDQVWLPYGATVPADDFTGKFKVVWTQDSIYILAEIKDDVLDVNNPDPTTHYWEYDCLEIFIDEDNSGGEHERNFNAFSYHCSAEGNAIDISSDGSGINIKQNVNISFANNGNDTYTWEIAMAVFDDTYDPSGTNTPIVLENDTLGFSVAYCDADNLNNVERENFFGSTYVTEANQNRHYQNADDFGDLVLFGGSAVNDTPEVIKSIDDVELNILDEEVSVVENLNTIFMDVDGDELTYSASSDNSDLRVSIKSNSALFVVARDVLDGAVIVTVKASDGELEAETTFEVTYVDTSVQTSVNDVLLSRTVAIYPNPANNYLNLDLNNDYVGDVFVYIFDYSGKLVLSEIYNKSYFDFNRVINVSTLNSAIYFIEVKAGELNQTKMLLVK